MERRLEEQAWSEQASQCRLDRGFRGETYATASHWHLQAAGRWRTEIIPTMKHGDVSRACTPPISPVAWARQLCSRLSHSVKISECHFSPDSVQSLKHAVIRSLAARGLSLHREEGDHEDVPLYFRYLNLLSRASRDPEVALGSLSREEFAPDQEPHSQGSQHCTEQRKMEIGRSGRPRRLPRGGNCGGPVVEEELLNSSRHFQTKSKTFSTIRVREVGQVLKLSERKARIQYPDLVVAALEANKKERSPTGSFQHGYFSTGPTTFP